MGSKESRSISGPQGNFGQCFGNPNSESVKCRFSKCRFSVLKFKIRFYFRWWVHPRKTNPKSLGALCRRAGIDAALGESAICSSRVHPPSEIKSNFKFKTLRWRPLRWRLTLSDQPLPVSEKVRQYTSNLYGSTPPICTAMLSWLLSFEERETLAIRLPFVRQYAPHLYGSTLEKNILGVGVTGTFLKFLGVVYFEALQQKFHKPPLLRPPPF